MSAQSNSDKNNRKSSRYPVKDSTAVMLPLMNVISYHVLDISKYGLSFCYYGKASRSEESDMIMTFFTDNAGSTDIPVQIIADTELNIKHLPFLIDTDTPHLPYLRRCGVKFAPLSSDQEEIINHYINRLPIDVNS